MEFATGSAVEETNVKKSDGVSPTYGWSIKGITFETKAHVKRAAKLVQKPIGIWVNDVLHRAAIETIKSASAPPAEIYQKPSQDLEHKVDKLADLVQALLEDRQGGKQKEKTKGKFKAGKGKKGSKKGKKGKK
jgi:hypothetical protein